MELQVNQRRGCVFDGRPALIEPARGEKLVDERLGHRFAGFIVEREAAQHLRLLNPVLKNLRGKLDKVAGDVGSGNTGIDDVGQHAVQGVTEFMEQSARVVDAQKTGLAVAAPSEVHHIDDDRQLRSVEFLLTAETAHPRATSLRRPREVITEKERLWRAVSPLHVPRANIGVVELEIEAFAEGHTEQAACAVEGGVDDAVEL